MTRYQLLKSNEEVLNKFIKAGIMSYFIKRDIEIYESYNQSTLKDNKTKYNELAEVYQLSPQRIEQIVYLMQK